jgi:type I restriction enzyme M protein
MLTGEIRNQIDQIWNAFWSGGVSNPLSVIEQITYLLFIKRLDDLHTLEENKASNLGIAMERAIFPDGNDDQGRAYSDLRWSRFKNFEAREMMDVVADRVFPFLRAMGEEGSSYGKHMEGARLGFSNAALLAKAVDMLDKIPMDDRDTKGDLYEYMLGKIASAGTNGQFRTPRHIIRLMVEMMRPTPEDVICDPAAGTCGFLVAAGEYIRDNHPKALRDEKQRKHFHEHMFTGFDFDPTMLRIGSMNMTLHGVENPHVEGRDSLTADHGTDIGRFSLILANPPFSGSLDYEATSPLLRAMVRTRKTELLFLALFGQLMKVGGRAAIIVPNGALESDGAVFKKLRKQLLEENVVEAIIQLPHWVFKPYASVSTSIILYTKGGKTDQVWFYRLENDGFADDAQKSEIEGSDIPELMRLLKDIRSAKKYKEQLGKHRFVGIKEIESSDYDLCPRFYLRAYRLPEGVPTQRIGDLFHICTGSRSAASAGSGDIPFATSSKELKRTDEWILKEMRFVSL